MVAVKLGIVDTTFARVDMAAFALDELQKLKSQGALRERDGPLHGAGSITVMRRTVPGIKDLAVECKRLLENEKCDVVLALGMVGKAPIDTQCAHEASMGIMWAKLATNRHILEAIVHENEAGSEAELLSICENRARKHAVNAVLLASDPAALTRNAGKGIRQGKPDEGPLMP